MIVSVTIVVILFIYAGIAANFGGSDGFQADVGVLEFTVVAIRAVHRTWNVSVFRPAARLFFTLTYDLQLVFIRLDYTPPVESVNRIIRVVNRDITLIYTTEFKQVVNPQFLMQRLRLQKPWPYKLRMSEMLDVFVNAVDGRLTDK